MDKKILNIVVTGGPCGGKTTALDELTKLLRSYGYMVYLVNETATELINDGIKPFGDHQLDVKNFQSLLFDAQLAKENIRRKAAKLCSHDKIAILYDRGIFDNRGYIDDSIFDEFLKERNMSETEVIMRYDLVIHLVTAAIGKEDYYTTINNTARTETVDEARYRDKKTVEAWRMHPNLKIVGNDTLFDEKIEKVKNFIRAYIGEEEVLHQKRYLVNINDLDLNNFSHSIIKEYIEEFALSYDNDEIEIYSKSTINNSSYYTCINKKKNSDTKVCRTITENAYYDYKSKMRGSDIHKIRYNFIDNHERFRLDIFDMEGVSYSVLERDVVDSKRKTLPKFIKQAIDITNNRNYDDDSIFIDYNIENIYKKRK